MKQKAWTTNKIMYKNDDDEMNDEVKITWYTVNDKQ
jgi:hypothetical protein